MDKFDYINKLSKCLEELSDEEKNAALEYYKELFEDAGSENEQELIHKLGSPEELADNIIRESGIVSVKKEPKEKSTSQGVQMPDAFDFKEKEPQKEVKKNKTNTILIILILILTFPLWIGIGTLFGLAVALIATVFSLAVVGVSCIVSGIVLLFSSPGAGLIFLGVGLIVSSIFVLCIGPLFKLVIRFFKWLGGLIGQLYQNLFGKKEA